MIDWREYYKSMDEYLLVHMNNCHWVSKMDMFYHREDTCLLSSQMFHKYQIWTKWMLDECNLKHYYQTKEGNLRWLVWIDAGNTVYESNETNNRRRYESGRIESDSSKIECDSVTQIRTDYIKWLISQTSRNRCPIFSQFLKVRYWIKQDIRIFLTHISIIDHIIWLFLIGKKL